MSHDLKSALLYLTITAFWATASVMAYHAGIKAGHSEIKQTCRSGLGALKFGHETYYCGRSTNPTAYRGKSHA